MKKALDTRPADYNSGIKIYHYYQQSKTCFLWLVNKLMQLYMCYFGYTCIFVCNVKYILVLGFALLKI